MNENNSTKKSIMLFTKGFILLFIIPSVFESCNNNDSKSISFINESPTLNSILKDTSIIDTSKLLIGKLDTIEQISNQLIQQKQKKRTVYNRMSEGVSDEKLNGEPISLQMELFKKGLADNPDTIKNYLRGEYLNQERNFPRSIADNFEKGTSTEHISYPRLNYRVELFEDEYSKKPYKILGYSVRKEKEEIIVE